MPLKAQVENARKKALPKKRNPLLAADKTPEHAELIKRRRLGQTNLSVKPGQVGTNNATKPENLGPFDYAHLRAPLPDDLEGSEIFASHLSGSSPESYFLMRRSSDGFVSATGMFKAAFPWASHAQERDEKEFVKGHASTARDEIAGNVWITEHYAIELADEYGIVPWVAALLDASPITHSADDPAAAKSISPPPKFKFTAGDKAHLPPPNGTPRGSTPKSRGRPRGGSPAKSASPTKAASAKKPRATKASKEASAAEAREASASLQASLDNAASLVEPKSAVGEKEEEKVRVEVEQNTEVKGNKETTTTNVKIEMPSGSPELPLPESPEEMIEKAKEMVAEAKKIDGESSSPGSKRKAEELDDESDEEADNELQPAKKARLLEQTLKREKVRNRALIGVTATLAIGAIIPYFLG